MNEKQLYNTIVSFGADSVSQAELISVLRKCDALYHNGNESFLSDAEYDVLYQQAHQMYPSNTYFGSIGSDVRSGKVKLPYPMGSLYQSHEGEIGEYIRKYALAKEAIIVTDKLDGASVLHVYKNGKLVESYSRGNGTEGAKITRHTKLMPSVPQSIVGYDSMVVRAENIISKENFPKAQLVAKTRSGEMYKTARNMVSGLMNASENDKRVYQFIDSIGYEIVEPAGLDKDEQLRILASLGFMVVNSCTILGSQATDEHLTKILTDRKAVSDYELDGIVLDVNSGIRRMQINPSTDTLNPEYARKYKVAGAGNFATTEVIWVEWNISKDGYYKPRIVLSPVDLLGATITYCTGFNAKFIVDNKIGPDAVVTIVRNGDITPAVVDVQQPGQVILPEGAVWNATGVDLIDPDHGENPQVLYKQLVDFSSGMGIDSLKDGNVEALFNAGVTTPLDLVAASKEDICRVLGRSTGTKVYDSLTEKLTTREEYFLMGNLPCFGRGIGVRKMKALFEAFAGDMSKCSNIISVKAVEGFDVKTASKVVQGYAEYREFLEEVSDYVKFVPYKPPVQGKLTGKVVVMTGFRDAVLQNAIEAAGGKIGSTVSSKTSILIAIDPYSTSSKMENARKLGIKIMGKKEMEDYLNA